MKKSVALCVFFVSFYLFFGYFNFFSYGVVNNSNDFAFHFGRSSGNYSDELKAYYSEETFYFYPPLFHQAFFFFSVNQLLFYAANVFLICFFAPLLIFRIVKTWWGPAAYFFGVSTPHLWIFGATFPQALTFVFLLAYFFLSRKNKKALWLLVFGLLAALTHQHGFALFVLVGFFEAAFFLARFLKQKSFPKLVFPQLFNIRAVSFTALGAARINTFFRLFEFFLIHVNPAISFFALKSKEFFYLALAIVSLIFSFNDFRFSALAQVCFVLAAAPGLSKVSLKKKAFIFFLFFLSFVWFVFSLVMETKNVIIFV